MGNTSARYKNRFRKPEKEKTEFGKFEGLDEIAKIENVKIWLLRSPYLILIQDSGGRKIYLFSDLKKKILRKSDNFEGVFHPLEEEHFAISSRIQQIEFFNFWLNKQNILNLGKYDENLQEFNTRISKKFSSLGCKITLYNKIHINFFFSNRTKKLLLHSKLANSFLISGEITNTSKKLIFEDFVEKINTLFTLKIKFNLTHDTTKKAKNLPGLRYNRLILTYTIRNEKIIRTGDISKSQNFREMFRGIKIDSRKTLNFLIFSDRRVVVAYFKDRSDESELNIASFSFKNSKVEKVCGFKLEKKFMIERQRSEETGLVVLRKEKEIHFFQVEENGFLVKFFIFKTPFGRPLFNGMCFGVICSRFVIYYFEKSGYKKTVVCLK